jgi:hypothetical protein
VARNKYTITFEIRNPYTAQSSPSVSIEAMGIFVNKTAMEKNPNRITPPNILDAAPSETEPLEIRGLAVASTFSVKRIGQSNANPGEANTITVTLAMNIPLTSSAPASSISISGLRGASAATASISLTVTTQAASGSFSGKWNDDRKRLELSVLTNTVPGSIYVISFIVSNAKVAQESPSIVVESSGITIQPTPMENERVGKLSTKDDRGAMVPTIDGATAPLFILAPRFIERYVHQTGGSAWPANQNHLNFSFVPTVSLIPVPRGRASITISGLQGVDLPSGPVNITGDDANKFTDCPLSNCTGCLPCTRERGMWNAISRKLYLNLLSEINAFQNVKLKFKFNNAIIGQDSPVLQIEFNSEAVDMRSLAIPASRFDAPSDVVGTDNVALHIYRSASFTVKTIVQSSSSPGGTTTITVSFQPQFALTGSKRSTITISGLIGSVTPDATIMLLDADALFNATAKWAAKTGTLLLSVAPGQTVPCTSTTVVKFDLHNPTIPQTGPSIVYISAMGDVPISAAAMTLGTGTAEPLKVVASTFVLADVGQSSSAPGAANLISVTIQPSIILSKSRGSTITIHGIHGTNTSSTLALPINMSGADSPVFTTPIPDIGVSFSQNCKLEDDKIQLLVDSDVSLNDTTLYFNSPIGHSNCSSRWTKVKNYVNGCATLAVNSGSWSDGRPKCTHLGFVREARVISGGTGYKTGASIVVNSSAGSGLSGMCNADSESGKILSVSLSSKGIGYSPDTKLSCPAACNQSSQCGASQNGAQNGEIVLSFAQTSVTVLAGQWNQRTGTLVLNVHRELSITSPTMFSFTVQNSLKPKGKSELRVMAGGLSPIGSTVMNGTALLIEGTNSSRTAKCACAPASGTTTCTCSTNIAGLPTGRSVYVLKAELQCNSATSVVVTVNSVAQSSDVVMQPPQICKDACQKYHKLFEWLNVASSVSDQGVLPLSVQASSVGTDYCGAGDNLKVLFTLYY